MHLFRSVLFCSVLHPYIGQVQPLDVALKVEAVQSRLSVVYAGHNSDTYGTV
jgi:hypothetical protein